MREQAKHLNKGRKHRRFFGQQRERLSKQEKVKGDVGEEIC